MSSTRPSRATGLSTRPPRATPSPSATCSTTRPASRATPASPTAGPQREPHAPEEIVGRFWELPLEFEPGSTFRYNNSGYVLLGALIERVTGQPYDVALRERLLGPLGLLDSGYDHYAEVIDGLAYGYEQAPDGSHRRAAYLDTSYPYAAGMMYATAADLHAWTRALHQARPFQRPPP